jgi:hypothetical protein
MRTIKEIDGAIAKAVEKREQFAQMAKEEKDKDYRLGLYRNVDRCNEVIDELVREKANSRSHMG